MTEFPEIPHELPPGLLGVCAIGASAGGLEALEQFFSAVPEQSGVAFIVVQHLSPDHKSLMAELLARHTRVVVRKAEDGRELQPDTIYLNPPKTDLSLEGNRLRLRAFTGPGLHLPIDSAFTSLGAAFGDKAIGVVLSGTGSDGTRGARELKAAGGLVLAQDPVEAQFDGMPRSLAATGLADQVAPAAGMAERILHFLHRGAAQASGSESAPRGPLSDVLLHRVVALLRDRTGTDFTGYKPTTVVRRIERRIQMHAGVAPHEYVDLLQSSQKELQELLRDLLINVTGFFRDPAAFEVLEQRVVPALLKTLPREGEIRIWVPGCSTGEEAYSLAMLLLEALQASGDTRELKVFATDVDPEALEVASRGWYPESIAADVPPGRLARFFQREGEGHRVVRLLRDRVVFARHNLLRDPPLTRMDLVSCRNLLIYFGQELQRRSVALLTYALRERGILFLGPSESLGVLQHHFEVIDQKWKIFQALNAGRQSLVETFPLRTQRRLQPTVESFLPPGTTTIRPVGLRGGPDEQMLDRVYQELARSLELRCLVLDGDANLLHAFGAVNDILHLPAGRTTLEIYRLLPKPIGTALRTALGRAQRENTEVAYEGIAWGEGQPPMTLRVRPVELPGDRMRAFLVYLQSGQLPLVSAAAEAPPDPAAVRRVAQLEQEIQYAREHLQATVEELETSNEELQATNEELLASNEELQSTNEELQSVNEELQTVNAEYQEKIRELVDANNDIENLMRATGVAIVFLDRDARIRRYTAGATQLLHLLPQDVGRPISHIGTKVPGFDAETVARRVLESGMAESTDMSLAEGTMLHVRVMPFLTRQPGSGGTILSLLDVTEVKRGERRLQSVLDAMPSSVAVVGSDGTILQVNRAWSQFARENGGPPALTAGVGLNYLATCFSPDADASATAAARGLRGVLEGRLEHFELEYPCHSPTEQRWFVLKVTPLQHEMVRGAVVQHVDVSIARRQINRLTAWAEQVAAIPDPQVQAALGRLGGAVPA